MQSVVSVFEIYITNRRRTSLNKLVRNFISFESRINSVEDLSGMGLFLNDLNPHGLSKEMVMAGWQHCSR